MNKEVILKNGLAYVKDHNGEERKIAFIDNLDEVLIQENIVEIIEKIIIAFENSSSNFKKNKLLDLLYIEFPIIATIIVPTSMMYLNTGSLEGLVNTKFGLMEKEKFLALFVAAFTPIALRMSKKWYQEYEEKTKCEKGMLLALYHLRSSLVIQNKRLDDLKNESKKIDVNEEKKYSLNEDSIDILQDSINLYYELGYNIKEYYECFRINGCLPNEVRQDYSDAEVEIIEEYLKNNGPKIKKM